MLGYRSGKRRLGGDDGDDRTAQIRALNDAFRCGIPRTGEGTRLILTERVGSLLPVQLASIVASSEPLLSSRRITTLTASTTSALSSMTASDTSWKIDAYDRWMQFGSPDAADPSVTTRVLTIMRADEY